MNERPDNKSFGRDRPESSAELKRIWDRVHVAWNSDFNNAWKSSHAEPLLAELSDEGKLGKVVVDVAAGHSTLVRDLMGKHIVGTIDIVPPHDSESQHFAIETDLRKLDTPNIRTKRGLVQARKTLREHDAPEMADTFVFTDILNYVNFRKLMSELNQVLSPGGRFVIFNKPNLGFEPLGEPDATRLHSNSDLIEFLEAAPPKGLGFVVEKPKHRDYEFLNSLHERIQIVARKPEDLSRLKAAE